MTPRKGTRRVLDDKVASPVPGSTPESPAETSSRSQYLGLRFSRVRGCLGFRGSQGFVPFLGLGVFQEWNGECRALATAGMFPQMFGRF